MPGNQRHIPRFDTLTTPVRDAEGSAFSFGDFARNIRTRPSRTRLHRHDYLELFLFLRGTGTHLNDFTLHPVRAPALVFVDAGHVHAWPDALRLRGHMLSFDAPFALPPTPGHAPALFLPPAPVVIPLNPAEARTARQTFTRIAAEWEHRPPGWLRAVRACVQLLHTDALRAWTRQAPTAPADNAAARLCREFLLLMEQHVHAATRPATLATLLKVSPDHLSAVLRSTTGRSAQEHLQERLLLEARRLLAHSRLDIAEIAYALGYRDVSYFGRVFRRRYAQTPGQFRTTHTTPQT